MTQRKLSLATVRSELHRLAVKEKIGIEKVRKSIATLRARLAREKPKYWFVFDINGVIVKNIDVDILRSFSREKKLLYPLVIIKYLLWLIPYQKGLMDAQEFWDHVLCEGAWKYAKARYEKNDYFDRKTLKTIRELKQLGHHIAILSNSNDIMSASFRKEGFYNFADWVFLSDEIHLIKPMPSVYMYVKRALGVKARQLILIDDSLWNVIGAQLVGWRSVRFHGNQGEGRLYERIRKFVKISEREDLAK